jgi:hypothetical protein
LLGRSGWNPVKGEGVEGPLKNFCG